MFQIRSLFALLLVAAPAAADAPKEGDLNPRQAADAYLTAVLAGKGADALTFAVPGKQAATDKHIQEVRKLVGSKTVSLINAYASEKTGRAIVISEIVKVTKANPDGKDTAHLLIQVEKSGGKWMVQEVDIRQEDNMKERVKVFKDRYDDAKEVPAK